MIVPRRVDCVVPPSVFFEISFSSLPSCESGRLKGVDLGPCKFRKEKDWVQLTFLRQTLLEDLRPCIFFTVACCPSLLPDTFTKNPTHLTNLWEASAIAHQRTVVPHANEVSVAKFVQTAPETNLGLGLDLDASCASSNQMCSKLWEMNIQPYRWLQRCECRLASKISLHCPKPMELLAKGTDIAIKGASASL